MATKPEDELAAAARRQREAERQMTMSERLAALHELCKQLSPMSPAAARRRAQRLENLPPS